MAARTPAPLSQTCKFDNKGLDTSKCFALVLDKTSDRKQCWYRQCMNRRKDDAPKYCRAHLFILSKHQPVSDWNSFSFGDSSASIAEPSKRFQNYLENEYDKLKQIEVWSKSIADRLEVNRGEIERVRSTLREIQSKAVDESKNKDVIDGLRTENIRLIQKLEKLQKEYEEIVENLEVLNPVDSESVLDQLRDLSE